MPWNREKDNAPEFADEIWSGIESVEPHCVRQQLPCCALKVSVVFHTFGATSSILQTKIQTWLQRLSAYWHLRHDMLSAPDLSAARSPHWLEATRCGRPRSRETSVTGHYFWRDAVTSRFPRAMVTHGLSTFGGLRCSLQVFTHWFSVTLTKHFQNPEEALQTTMPHATTKEKTLGEYHDPDLEVSLIQQRERFKRSLARVDVLDISEISWLGAVARIQARSDANSTNAFRNGSCRHQSPRAPRGAGLGKLHRHVNSPNVARSLRQVSTEEGVLRSTPSALMDVRDAVWAKRWQRGAVDSIALGAELVALRAQAIAEDVPLFGTSYRREVEPNLATHSRQHKLRQ